MSICLNFQNVPPEKADPERQPALADGARRPARGGLHAVARQDASQPDSRPGGQEGGEAGQAGPRPSDGHQGPVPRPAGRPNDRPAGQASPHQGGAGRAPARPGPRATGGGPALPQEEHLQGPAQHQAGVQDGLDGLQQGGNPSRLVQALPHGRAEGPDRGGAVAGRGGLHRHGLGLRQVHPCVGQPFAQQREKDLLQDSRLLVHAGTLDYDIRFRLLVHKAGHLRHFFGFCFK